MNSEAFFSRWKNLSGWVTVGWFCNRPPSAVVLFGVDERTELFFCCSFILQNESGSAKDFPGDATDRRHTHPDEIERHGYETTGRYRSQPWKLRLCRYYSHAHSTNRLPPSSRTESSSSGESSKINETSFTFSPLVTWPIFAFSPLFLSLRCTVLRSVPVRIQWRNRYAIYSVNSFKCERKVRKKGVVFMFCCYKLKWRYLRWTLDSFLSPFSLPICISRGKWKQTKKLGEWVSVSRSVFSSAFCRQT